MHVYVYMYVIAEEIVIYLSIPSAAIAIPVNSQPIATAVCTSIGVLVSCDGVAAHDTVVSSDEDSRSEISAHNIVCDCIVVCRLALESDTSGEIRRRTGCTVFIHYITGKCIIAISTSRLRIYACEGVMVDIIIHNCVMVAIHPQ